MISKGAGQDVNGHPALPLLSPPSGGGYQIFTISFSGRYMASPGFTLKAW